MPKFFVVSDVHGFYHEMLDALDNAGFDPNNEDHWLISCGDNFDRGPCPEDVMVYLKMLPRKILIRGNHEKLLVECCERGYPGMHDMSNGTFGTINEFGDAGSGYAFDECCIRTLARTHTFLDSMVNYFETKNYVFCHGFIPVTCNDNLPPYYRRNRPYSKMENWRDASQYQWDDAAWLCSFDMIAQGFGIEKCIVAGHWHASYGRHMVEGTSEFGTDADFSPFNYNNKLIMIDGCTAHSGKVNCLVIEDEFLEGDIN
jgi:hypothetical protein